MPGKTITTELQAPPAGDWDAPINTVSPNYPPIRTFDRSCRCPAHVFLSITPLFFSDPRSSERCLILSPAPEWTAVVIWTKIVVSPIAPRLQAEGRTINHKRIDPAIILAPEALNAKHLKWSVDSNILTWRLTKEALGNKNSIQSRSKFRHARCRIKSVHHCEGAFVV